jgi:hypothetical protein
MIYAWGLWRRQTRVGWKKSGEVVEEGAFSFIKLKHEKLKNTPGVS